MVTMEQLAVNRRIINAWIDDTYDMPERYIIRLQRLASEPGAATAQTVRETAEHFDDMFGERSDLLALADKLY